MFRRPDGKRTPGVFLAGLPSVQSRLASVCLIGYQKIHRILHRTVFEFSLKPLKEKKLQKPCRALFSALMGVFAPFLFVLYRLVMPCRPLKNRNAVDVLSFYPSMLCKSEQPCAAGKKAGNFLPVAGKPLFSPFFPAMGGAFPPTARSKSSSLTWR